MKARFKLVGLIFCLVLFLVPTFHFQAIPAEGDKAADAKEIPHLLLLVLLNLMSMTHFDNYP